MDSNKLVWYPDIKHGYSIGQIVDISRDRVFVKPLANPSQTSLRYEVRQGSEQATEFAYKSVYPCDPLDLKTLEQNNWHNPTRDVDDNCALIHLNEAALLENVRLRFQQDKIYTYVAHILVAINPYFEIKQLHSAEAILNYQGKSLGTMPPHVYAIGESHQIKHAQLAKGWPGNHHHHHSSQAELS